MARRSAVATAANSSRSATGFLFSLQLLQILVELPGAPVGQADLCGPTSLIRLQLFDNGDGVRFSFKFECHNNWLVFPRFTDLAART
jgi:hypothetical protein